LPSGRVLAVVVVASVFAGVAFAALFGRDAAPAEPGNASCNTNDPLRVTADEAIAPTLSALADQFADAVNAEDRPCVQVVIRSMSSRDVVTALVRGWDTAADGPPPDVWIPNSSVWLDVYRNESSTPDLLPQDAVLLARSPLLFAMPQPMAEALPLSTVKWRELLELPDLEGVGAHSSRRSGAGLSSR
jgi:Ca-activated chloride channel family protein